MTVARFTHESSCTKSLGVKPAICMLCCSCPARHLQLILCVLLKFQKNHAAGNMHLQPKPALSAMAKEVPALDTPKKGGGFCAETSFSTASNVQSLLWSKQRRIRWTQGCRCQNRSRCCPQGLKGDARVHRMRLSPAKKSNKKLKTL